MRLFFTLVLVLAAVFAINAQVIAGFDFEDGMPEGWIAESEWKFGNSQQLGSQYFPLTGNNTKFTAINSDKAGSGKAKGRLITDTLDFTDYPDVFLSMDLIYIHANYDGGGQETLGIYYTEDGETWNLIKNITEPYLWDKFYMVVSPDVGGKKVKIAFDYSDGGNWNFGAGIDNIIFEVQPDHFLVEKLPQQRYGILSSPETEELSFEIGFLSYGLLPLEDFKLVYSIDGVDFEAITGEGPVEYNSEYFFNVPGFKYGESTLTSKVILNDTIEYPNSDVMFEVVTPIPQYARQDVYKNDFDLHADLSSGKAVLLDFLASWCGPCATSTPLINNVWKEYDNGEDRFQIYGITIEPTDNENVIKSLTWDGQYPKFDYTPRNRLLYNIFNDQYGENAIPLFILVCPDTTNHIGFSTVTWSKLGAPATLGTELRAAVKNCVGSPSSTNDINIGSVILYPNPARDIVTLQLDLIEDLDAQIYLTDLAGRKIRDITRIANYNSLRYTFDISDLNAGTYLLNINTKYGTRTEKIIKQ